MYKRLFFFSAAPFHLLEGLDETIVELHIHVFSWTLGRRRGRWAHSLRHTLHCQFFFRFSRFGSHHVGLVRYQMAISAPVLGPASWLCGERGDGGEHVNYYKCFI